MVRGRAGDGGVVLGKRERDNIMTEAASVAGQQ
jgi:hypothetical protein